MLIETFVLKFFQGGLGNLAAYLAAHVSLCLVPAFFIAGGMTALIPKPAITRFLGRNTPKFISYPASALAGSVLAVCSCTIVPLFAGIYKKGAGLGPAITFLFFAPAANILALVYTGGIIGVDLALARLFLSLAFGIGIGMIMALIFSREDAEHDKATDELFAGHGSMSRPALIFLLILVALLLAGTLKLAVLTNVYTQATLPIPGMDRLQSFLYQLVPFDPNKGEERVTAQGAILIGLLILIGLAAWRGLENILDEFNTWAKIALGLVALTLLVAAAKMTPHASGLDIGLTGRVIGVGLAILILAWIAHARLEPYQVQEWCGSRGGLSSRSFPCSWPACSQWG